MNVGPPTRRVDKNRGKTSQLVPLILIFLDNWDIELGLTFQATKIPIRSIQTYEFLHTIPTKCTLGISGGNPSKMQLAPPYNHQPIDKKGKRWVT